MSKVSKIHGTDFNALNAMYVEDVGDGVCGFYATLYAEYTLYTVAPRPARREGSLLAVRPVGLAVHHQAVRGGSFVLKCSGTCQTTRVIAGKTYSQSPILTVTKGALSNPVILTYL